MAEFGDTIELTAPNRDVDAELDVLRLGFLPLTDCAPLLVADELGFFSRHDVSVRLTRLQAWVALRDHIAIGRLDGGQMLSPMPIAAALGLGGIRTDLAVVARRARGAVPPKLAVVFPFSSHNYLLRHWLASAGLDPELDVDLCAMPPPLVAGELADGRIDGFCAGQPWGSRAVDLRCGRIALTTADIWPDHPEKVLAVSATRLARRPEQVAGAVAAMIEAGGWLSDSANHAHAADILRRRAMPEVPEAVLVQSLGDSLVRGPDEAPFATSGLRFDARATYPHPEHAAWWLRQMRLWRHLPQAVSDDFLAGLWRPDVWRRGADLAGVTAGTPPLPPCPGGDAA